MRDAAPETVGLGEEEEDLDRVADFVLVFDGWIVDVFTAEIVFLLLSFELKLSAEVFVEVFVG